MTTPTQHIPSPTRIHTIALIGNPNSGKTTLFNAFTKLRQKVGNYPGVTVEKRSGTLVLARDRVVNVLDLPGIYSLSVRSPDEQIARDVLLGRTPDTPKPDMVICVGPSHVNTVVLAGIPVPVMVAFGRIPTKLFPAGAVIIGELIVVETVLTTMGATATVALARIRLQVA